MPSSIDISDEIYDKFKKLVVARDKKFVKVFSHLTRNNTPRFLNANVDNRHPVRDEDDDMVGWNNLNNQLGALAEDLEMPFETRWRIEDIPIATRR